LDRDSPNQQILAAGKNFKRDRLSVFLIRSHKSQTGSIEAAVRLDRLRDRWELSHLVRAVLALVSLVPVAAVNT